MLALLVRANGMSVQATTVWIVATVLAIGVLVLVLSGFKATIFQDAPDGSWRKRVPSIFLDVARFFVIAAGRCTDLLRHLGRRRGRPVRRAGHRLHRARPGPAELVGQIISGLLLLFEQPFRIGDWIATKSIDRSRVVEVNWRATHLDSGTGIYVIPNSLLASDYFVNLSIPRDAHRIVVETAFAVNDSPDTVCAMLVQVAQRLPQLRPGAAVSATPGAAGRYSMTIPVRDPGEDGAARSTFLRWIWYASRRHGLHLDNASDSFPGPAEYDAAVRTVGQTLRIPAADRPTTLTDLKVTRFGTGETLQCSGDLPTELTFGAARRGPDDGRRRRRGRRCGGSNPATTSVRTALTRERSRPPPSLSAR